MRRQSKQQQQRVFLSETDDDFINNNNTLADEEEEDVELTKSISMWRWVVLWSCYPDAFKLEVDRLNMILMKEDLDLQYNNLHESIKQHESRFVPKYIAFKERLDALRKHVTEKMFDLGYVNGFTKADVEEHVTSRETILMGQVTVYEAQVKRMRANLKLLIVYLNNLNQLRSQARCVLLDIQTLGSIEAANKAAKNARGIDVKQFSESVSKQLQEMATQLGTMSKLQERLMMADQDKDEVTATAALESKNALDLLFKDGKKMMMPSAATVKEKEEVIRVQVRA